MQDGTVPLLMLSYTYNELAATAARDHLITIDSVNERVLDGPDLSRSPYTSGQFFLVAFPTPAHGGTMSLYVGPEFWLGNTAAPSTVRLDFGDGWGPRTVAMGTTIQVALPTSSRLILLKQGVSRPPISRWPDPIIVPLPSLTNGGTIQVTNPIANARGVATFIWGEPSIPSILPDLALGLVAQRGWPGFISNHSVHFVDYTTGRTRATAIAWIKYAASNRTGKLRRPLVFVEGIDFDSFRNGHKWLGNLSIAQTGPIPLSNFNVFPRSSGGFRNGSAGWNEVVDYNPGYKSLEQFPALRAQLLRPPGQVFPGGVGGDYDLVYLDFSDGASLIQDNAMVFVELLQWINQPANRTADAEETLVIGASMGGQVARFGLAWMEQQGLCHNSKLYVSFDSPHRGANISLGVQYLFDRLQSIWVGAGSAEAVVQDLLRREAAEQMLVVHFADEADHYRTAWQAWQASPGSYPSLLRKVAIANGSGQAVPQTGMFPGQRLLHTDENTSWLGIKTTTQMVAGRNYAYALPGIEADGTDHVIFRWQRAVSYSNNNWHHVQAQAGWSNFDTAPGSSTNTQQTASQKSDRLIADWNSHTFMPTLSTLDVKDAGSYSSPDFGYDVQNRIPNDKPNSLKYAFDAYYSANGVNEPHIQVTNSQPSSIPGNPSFYTNNSSWIQNELRESAHHLPARLTTAYNYGSLYRHLLPSVQVNSGGQLYINNPALPTSGGTPASQTPPQEPRFDVYTSNCGTVVQVTSGGQLTVGTSVDYQATLLLSANGLLDLEAGSRLDVGPGSLLHVVAGATLVVHQGATLNLAGYVQIDAGAYVCVENPTSITTTGNGSYDASLAATYGANPALVANPALSYLNLGALACGQPPFQVNITNYAMTSQCTSPSGKGNYAQWTATVQGGSAPYTYAWYLDPTATGNNYQLNPPGSLVIPNGNSSTFSLCLNGYSYYVLAKVVATAAGGQQGSATYYGLPQMAVYPNPADGFTDLASDTGFGAAATVQPASPATATTAATPASGHLPPMQVTVYNGQGTAVFTAPHVTTPALRLPTRAWPNGLY